MSTKSGGQRGSTLISVLVGVGVMGILAMNMSSMFSGAFKAEDFLRSNADLEEMKRSLRLIFSRQKLCEKAGLVGLRLDPSAPEKTEVTLKSPTTGAVMLKEGQRITGSNWTTDTLRVTGLAAAGGSSYLATLRFDGSYRASGGPVESTVSKSRKTAASLLPIDFPVLITLNASNIVQSCGDSSNEVPEGTMCGQIFYERINGDPPENIQPHARCNGFDLTPSNGCPTGFKRILMAYSWGHVTRGTFQYFQESCVKE